MFAADINRDNARENLPRDESSFLCDCLDEKERPNDPRKLSAVFCGNFPRGRRNFTEICIQFRSVGLILERGSARMKITAHEAVD